MVKVDERDKADESDFLSPTLASAWPTSVRGRDGRTVVDEAVPVAVDAVVSESSEAIEGCVDAARDRGRLERTGKAVNASRGASKTGWKASVLGRR